MPRKLFPASFALALSLLLAGPLRAQTTVTGTIQSGGLTREYRLYVPASYRAGTPVPLLFNLHGFGSNNVEQENYGDFRPIADTANFLVVHPNGTLTLGARAWNTFGTPGAGVNDVGFISDLITDLQGKYTIDANRVYSTGMSNGGFMSYELACQLSSRIAAVASVTGSISPNRLSTPGACAPQHPTPVLQIHGTADTTVPYAGGLALGVAPTTGIVALLAYWVQVNGNAPTPTVTLLPDRTTADNSTVERSVWSGGRNGAEVQHLRVIGGGHTWPGTAFTQGGSGATNQDINASVEVWRFLRRFRLSRLLGLGAAPPAPASLLGLSVSPNPAGADGRVLVRATRPLLPAQVALLDLLGRRLPAPGTAGPAGTVQLDLGAVTKGIYLIQIEQNGRRYQQRIAR